jgi:hypothetical protein
MASDPGTRRVYRLPASRSWPALVVCAVLLAGFLVRMSLDDDVPAMVPVIAGVVFAAGYAVLVRLVTRSATTVDDEGLHLRLAFGRHTLRWPDVQAIEIESTVRDGAKVPQDRTYVYDTAGVRRELPYINEVTVAELPAEVDQLRAVWRLRRGEEWREEPAVSAEIQRRSVQLGWPLIGLTGLVSGFLIGMAVFVAMLIGDVYPKTRLGEAEPGFIVGVLLSPVALLAVAPIAGVMVAVVVTLLRRRRREIGR